MLTSIQKHLSTTEMFTRADCQSLEDEILPDGRMTPEQASAYLGLSVQTLAKERWSGGGPKFIKRGRIFYYREDLDEWLRSARVSSNAEEKARRNQVAKP
jgi:Helix-turn-helix domain